jgi:exopolysaccharide biosynthesis protein
MFKTVLIFLFNILLFISSISSQTIFKKQDFNSGTNLSKEIVKGLTYETFVNKADSISANILEINLKENNFVIDAIKADDKMKAREKTSSMLNRFDQRDEDALAAVNADFFNIHTGENENNLVINGEIAKGVEITDSPYDTFNNIHSQFAITFNNKPAIDRFKFTGFLLCANKSLKINTINSEADSNAIILYNRYQGESTPETSMDWKIEEVEITPIDQNGDTLVCLKAHKTFKAGGNSIPQKGFILSINNSMIKTFNNTFANKDTLKLILEFLPRLKKMRTLVGGWPRIIRDGKNIAPYIDSLEGTFYKFSEVKHPRTGIGFSKDSTIIYLVTVDGRQESMSGMTLNEFADFMLSLGVYQALNLDGGGSTTMVINGEVVNSPSDSTGERKVGNCIVVSIRSK